MTRFSIIYEDPNLIVLSKPAGLLSQGEKKGDTNLVDELRGYLGRHYVGLVHRLDRNTSGLMVVAKRSKAAQRLTQALQEGKINRIYLAWVVGKLGQETRWKHQIEKNQAKNISRVVSHGGKEAVLQAKPIRTLQLDNSTITLVEFTLETGRSHQIRVQASYENFPLLGELKYRGNTATPPFPRVALHSAFLSFPHPISQVLLEFKDPLPPDLDLR